MAATLSGLVIGTQSLTARRIIIPDDDAYLDTVAASLPLGMTLVKIPRASLPDHSLSTILPIASQILGQTITPQQRYAVVDAAGNVVDVHIVDPLLVQPPQGVTPAMSAGIAAVAQVTLVPKPPFSFVRHDTAAIGGTIVSAVYTAPPDATKAVQGQVA